MHAIYKLSPGIAKQRMTVKAFRYSEDMHKFLCIGSNGLEWFEVKPGNPCKAGVYAYAGGQWHNVKHLDISALAHI